MKPSLMIGVLLLASTTLRAQVGIPGDQTRNMGQNVFGLGFSAGLVSGFGLSFRHHLPSQFSYQVVGGVIKFEERMRYDIGTEAQFDFIRQGRTRFYGAGGLGYFYTGNGNNELDAPFRAGLGIGVEQGATSGLNFSVDLLFTYFSDGTILPLPQVGMHYYFY